MHLVDTGVMYHWMQRTKNEVKQDLKKQVPYQVIEQEPSTKLNMSNFGGVFVMFSVVMSLSVISFFAESVYYYRTR